MRHMALDTQINRNWLISVYPDLGGDVNFKILSDPTRVYNCIAWAMGYTDRWVDTVIAPGVWWPAGAKRSYLPESLIEAFKAEGFTETDNCLPEDGYEKVLLYKDEEANEWRHASRVVSAGVEHSKFGNAWDAQHSHNVLCTTSAGSEASSYGTVYACMKRRHRNSFTPIVGGRIKVNTKNAAKIKMTIKPMNPNKK